MSVCAGNTTVPTWKWRTASPTFDADTGNIKVANRDGVDRRAGVNRDFKDWAPRFGFAYQAARPHRRSRWLRSVLQSERQRRRASAAVPPPAVRADLQRLSRRQFCRYAGERRLPESADGRFRSRQ